MSRRRSNFHKSHRPWKSHGTVKKNTATPPRPLADHAPPWEWPPPGYRGCWRKLRAPGDRRPLTPAEVILAFRQRRMDDDLRYWEDLVRRGLAEV